MHVSLKNVHQVDGFAASNALPGEYLWVHFRGSVTSDDPLFHKYMDQIGPSYLSLIHI